MKQLKNSAPFSMLLCFLLSIFIVFGVNKAFADPQTFPFDFLVPGLGDLEWENIDNDGGDLTTGSPFSGDCAGSDPENGTGLNISDAISANGAGDAYDTAWLTAVNTTFVGTAGPGDLTGNTFTQGPQNISGLDVTYQLFFSAETQCNRLVLFFDNTKGGPISETVRIATNFGSDDGTVVEGTSSGDTTFTTADRWLVTSDSGDPSGDPVLTNVYYGPGSPAVTPNFVTSLVCGSDGGNSPGAGAQYEITVPQLSTRCLMLFACLGDITGLQNTIAGALAAAPLFNSNDTIPGDLLSGLSEQQLLECVNWDFPEPPPEPIPTLSEWGLIAMAGILGIVGFMVMRRRKVTA